MRAIIRWDPFRIISSLTEQVNRLFESSLPNCGGNSALATRAPAVDIYQTENELVLKADLPDIHETTWTSALRTTCSASAASGSLSNR